MAEVTNRPDDRSEDGMGYLGEDGTMHWEPEPKPEPVKRPKRKKKGAAARLEPETEEPNALRPPPARPAHRRKD